MRPEGESEAILLQLELCYKFLGCCEEDLLDGRQRFWSKCGEKCGLVGKTSLPEGPRRTAFLEGLEVMAVGCERMRSNEQSPNLVAANK